MDPLWLAYVGIPVATIAIDAVLSYWAYTRHRETRGAMWFVTTLALGIVWMLFHLLHLLSTDPSVEWVGLIVSGKIGILAVLTYVLFASRYTRADYHRRLEVQVMIGLALGSVLLPTVFEPVRSIVYQDVTYVSGALTYIAVEPGILYAGPAILLVVLVGYALVSFTRYLLSTPRRSGLQLVMIVVGSLSVASAIALGDLAPAEGMNHASYGALPFSVLVAFALFRFRLFEMKPVARSAVVQDLRDPVLVLDEDGRLADYNAAATRVWPDIESDIGRSLAEASHELAERLTLPPTGEESAERISLHSEEGVRHYSVTVSEASRGSNGDIAWYSILLRDITELEQSRWQLEKQNERLDQVASTISHDLRNPISVVDGNIELAEVRFDEADVDDELQEAILEKLQSAELATDRMQDIIDDILTIAREGKTVEDTETVSLDATARDAWATVDTKQATLTTDDRTLRADRSKLRTILENLLRNALDHGPDDVSVEVGATRDGFYVADDGPGIPPEHADSVFEYGYTTSEEGTGLGLSIVRTMAESHGWTVEHDDTYDSGTRFVFGNVDTHRGSATDEERVLVP